MNDANMTVLIADNCPIYSADLGEWLTKEGVVSLVAHCAGAAHDHIKSHPEIDFFFVELFLGDSNGLMLVEEIRCMELHKQKPIWIVTTEPKPSIFTEEALQRDLGCNGWLTKPVKFHRLLEVLMESCALR
ncbi:MAG: response regulator [Myxococcota bacterium]|nr:response regulator [Myxococcota bacterium]